MMTTELIEQLINSIDKNAEYFDQLGRLLKEERQSIERSEYHNLKKIVERKEEIIYLADQAGFILNQLLKNMGYEIHSTTKLSDTIFQEIITKIPENLQTALKQAWKGLKKTLEETRKLNSANHHIVELTRKNIEHVINILKDASNLPSFYQENGRVYQHSSSYLLARI